jgi:hypothetical protein
MRFGGYRWRQPTYRFAWDYAINFVINPAGLADRPYAERDVARPTCRRPARPLRAGACLPAAAIQLASGRLFNWLLFLFRRDITPGDAWPQ